MYWESFSCEIQSDEFESQFYTEKEAEDNGA